MAAARAANAKPLQPKGTKFFTALVYPRARSSASFCFSRFLPQATTAKTVVEGLAAVNTRVDETDAVVDKLVTATEKVRYSQPEIVVQTVRHVPVAVT